MSLISLSLLNESWRNGRLVSLSLILECQPRILFTVWTAGSVPFRPRSSFFLKRFSFLPMPYYWLFVSSDSFWASKNYFKTTLTRISIQSICKFMANEEIRLCKSSDGSLDPYVKYMLWRSWWKFAFLIVSKSSFLVWIWSLLLVDNTFSPASRLLESRQEYFLMKKWVSWNLFDFVWVTNTVFCLFEKLNHWLNGYWIWIMGFDYAESSYNLSFRIFCLVSSSSTLASILLAILSILII